MLLRLALLALLRPCSALAPAVKRVLVVGGSGRVGGSTVAHLNRIALQRGISLETIVGGRSRKSFDAASERWPEVSASRFVECNVDDAASLDSALAGMDVVVHTAGPFQQVKTPNVLDAALRNGVAYLDVCDETALCELVKTPAYADVAKAKGVPCVVSAGIWPGVSALMAQLAVEELGGEAESLDFSFFTAGTGNAGPTIVSATFLLLCTPALVFEGGNKVDREAWSDARDVDFGDNGVRKVRLLDCPDVLTVAKALKIPNVSSRFSTAPEVWNQLFGVSKAVMPASLLSDRAKMQALAIFSEPIVRFVDNIVGAANVMRIDATAGGKKVTLVHGHEDLENAVGIATAAFAIQLVQNRIEPGIHWPSELSPDNRNAIVEMLLAQPGTFAWTSDAEKL